MLSVKKLRKRPRHFVRFTGLSVEQFDQLLADLEPVYRQHQAQRLNRAGRRRELGAGPPFRLPLADRLLATLLYWRLYLSGALLGYLFNLDESSLSRERNLRMLPALLEVLPVPLQDHLLSAVEQPEDAGQSQGQSRKTRPKRIGRNCWKRIQSLGKSGLMAPSRKCPSPKISRTASSASAASTNAIPSRPKW
jgi:Helix-turn-helix of DDE superfamily endonuclease